LKTSDPRYRSPCWQNATIMSLGHLFPDHYDRVVPHFLSNLTGAGLRHLVDLMCGNGVLGWLVRDIITITAGMGPVRAGSIPMQPPSTRSVFTADRSPR